MKNIDHYILEIDKSISGTTINGQPDPMDPIDLLRELKGFLAGLQALTKEQKKEKGIISFKDLYQGLTNDPKSGISEVTRVSENNSK